MCIFGITTTMLKRNLIITSDGSHSIHIPEWDEQYHSKHGAIQEAYHVFIKNGLNCIDTNKIAILEIGLGTGLNCFITFLEAEKYNLQVNYTGVEAFPISKSESRVLNYVDELQATQYKSIFETIHASEWEKEIPLSDHFLFTKRLQKFQELTDSKHFHLIYFDAFGARVQPELWTEHIFKIMYQALKKKGVLVTYAAKGSVRRAMQNVGFEVERLPGPPGKREMLRAVK
jgi:tRNA U34 5-methylaminomethyl-2-thiouridine-forming methyltransferase MnmC